MYIKLTNGQPEIYTIGQLRRDNPNTSFPKNIPDERLADYDVYPVTVLDRPSTEPWQRAVRDTLPSQNTDGNWVLNWTVEDIPVTVEMIKQEAQRRIYNILPEWKQRNLTARAAELAIKGVQNWSLDEQAEVVAGQALWDQIKIVRSKSDELEAMNPIPVDYIADKYWT
jgi:adenylate kinase family enzyme